MTDLLYQIDSYIKTFDAQITGVNAEEHGVVLDRTAFYPGGGGQPCDTGTLTIDGQAIHVLKLKKVDSQLLHYLDPSAALPSVGTPVSGQIDWDHRYKLMRTHTALHILCGVVFRDYGAQVTGGNMDPLEARMDFEFETMHQELVTEIERAVNEEVSHRHAIHVRILPREEAFQIPSLIRTKINLLPEGIQEVRVVEIEGVDMQADGGTHVASTGEVGRVRVTDYKSKGKINKRIYIELDDQ